MPCVKYLACALLIVCALETRTAVIAMATQLPFPSTSMLLKRGCPQLGKHSRATADSPYHSSIRHLSLRQLFHWFFQGNLFCIKTNTKWFASLIGTLKIEMRDFKKNVLLAGPHSGFYPQTPSVAVCGVRHLEENFRSVTPCHHGDVLKLHLELFVANLTQKGRVEDIALL